MFLVVEEKVVSHAVTMRSIERESRAIFTVNPLSESLGGEEISMICRLRLSLVNDDTKRCCDIMALLSDVVLYLISLALWRLVLQPHAVRHMQQRRVVFNLVIMI